MRSRNGDVTERHRRLKGKPQRNRPSLKRRKSSVYQGGKSASKLIFKRKPSEPRRPKNNRVLPNSEPTKKFARNGDNNNDVDGIQAQREICETDYVAHIERECIASFNSYSTLSLDNIAGLDMVKQVIKECWILPAKRPDLFKGLRHPFTGILLFGASGTGKTTLGKCIASEMRCTFFNVSPSTLASKWMGETEKIIRALFVVAKYRQPSVIFIDNIDCILSSGNPQENGAMRGIVNEFLLQMDSSSTRDEKIVVLGTTKRPQDLNAAARRRFEVRLQIPLLDEKGRKDLLKMLLEKEHHCLEERDLNELAQRTTGYSGADLKLLCQDAAMGPIRSIPEKDILKIQACKVRPIIKDDFHHALSCIKASISRKELKTLSGWNKQFGHKCSIKRKATVC